MYRLTPPPVGLLMAVFLALSPLPVGAAPQETPLAPVAAPVVSAAPAQPPAGLPPAPPAAVAPPAAPETRVQPDPAPASAAVPPAPPAAAVTASAAAPPADKEQGQGEEKDKRRDDHDKPWYERLKIRGYTQFRYNRFLETNDKLVNDQGDKSIGGTGGLFIRRARLILQGDITEHVSLYFQPDFASTAVDQIHVAILRDLYADVFVDKEKQLRFRIGQSKVPFGFENLQSSQNRAPFDRSDALNSAVKDERDLGLFVYWETPAVRKLFKELVDSGLKGSGDYGIVGAGVYNGQTANKLELNNTPHVVGRVTYPIQIGSQTIEIGGGGYYGKYNVKKDERVLVEEEDSKDKAFTDARVYGQLVWYPKPIGLQVEYNYGKGPEFSALPQCTEAEQMMDPEGCAERPIGEIKESSLHGGYAMLLAKFGNFVPYVRGVLYNGGRKFETNAPRYKTRELELGLEYQVIKALEVTAAYTFAERTYPKLPYKQENGRFLRLQVQVNY